MLQQTVLFLQACEPDYKDIIANATLRRRMSRIVKMGVACGLECMGELSPEKIGGNYHSHRAGLPG